LLRSPRRPVARSDIAALEDEDARENWEVMLEFRDRLLAAPTLEGAYLALVRGDAGRTPPLFLNQLTQVILRNALDGQEDPYLLRSAELLFRLQRVTVHEGALLIADAEVIEQHEDDRGASPLIPMFAGPAVTELDIMDESNAETYFERSDAFDMVLGLSGGPASRGPLARALELWIGHLLGAKVSIEPLARAEDQDWAWFVGLDAEATRIGNALWQGEEVEDPDRIIGIFRLTFEETEMVRPEVLGRTVWLFLAIDPDRMLRLKPQNLITGLPLRSLAETS
jgi:hypothetical protein